MTNGFQTKARISVFALTLAALAGQNAARASETKWDYFGRWTVDDPTDKFSANGKLYRMIDISPCGKDFCGVSVEGGTCGAILFRFFGTHDRTETLAGHGKWGSDVKKLFIYGGDDKPTLNISLGGANFDPESRSNSLPNFTADYHRTGDALCKVGAAGV